MKEHNPAAKPLSPRQFPGALPRRVVEAALPLEYPEPYEAGLLVAICPGCPSDGRPFKSHRLRVKIISPDTVDVFCPNGCDQRLLLAAIQDAYDSSMEAVA